VRAQPGEDLARVLVRREHRMEDVLDAPVADDEREAAVQPPAGGGEGRQRDAAASMRSGSASIANGSRSRSTASRWCSVSWLDRP
jgi:hypothetical protein